MNAEALITKHFHETRPRIIKRLTFQAGTVEAAEDIVQEAYYRALKYFNSYDGRAFDNWFSRIVYACLIDYKNAEKGLVYDEEPEEELIDCPAYPSYLMKEIYELIDTKSEVQIAVLSMHFKHGYSAKDVAMVTEWSYAQCHKIISRFREELRQLYAE